MICGLETSLVAKMTNLKLFCFGHIMRKSGYFGKDNYVGENRRQQKKRKTKYKMGWLHERRHRHNYRSWAGMLRTRHRGRHSFTGSLGVGADSTTRNTHRGTSIWVWEGNKEENSCYFNALLSIKETFPIVKNILWGLTLSNWDLSIHLQKDPCTQRAHLYPSNAVSTIIYCSQMPTSFFYKVHSFRRQLCLS